MKDGDIYFWRWKDEARHNDCGAFRSYHCKSRMAIARNGNLYDTFWGDSSHGAVNLNDVEITFQGNANEMAKIPEYNLPYYKPSDVVDMRHSNSFSAEIYLRVGAERDADTLRDHIQARIDDSESEIRHATNRIERLNVDIIAVNEGRLDDVIL